MHAKPGGCSTTEWEGVVRRQAEFMYPIPTRRIANTLKDTFGSEWKIDENTGRLMRRGATSHTWRYAPSKEYYERVVEIIRELELEPFTVEEIP